MDKAPKRKVVKRPKGTAARIEKQVATKLASKKPKKVVIKKPVSKMTYAEVVASDNPRFLYVAEENAQQGLPYGGIDWIDGVSERDDDFWRENHYKYRELSAKQQARIERIEEKVNVGIGPSIEKELERHFKAWKQQNKDKKMTIKAAQNAFENYYF
tara:strand:- start:59 stop:529 length:471 start_codon:yes stop_codon:yes gene_type:complete